VQVHHLLGQPGGHHPGGALPGDLDRGAGAFPGAGGQHQGAGPKGGDPGPRRHQLDPPIGADVGDVGIGQHVDVTFDHLLEGEVGVLGSGHILLEGVQPEAGVDALQEDPPGGRIAVDHQDALGPLVAGADGRGEAGGTGADDGDVVAAQQVAGFGGDGHLVNLPCVRS